MTETEILNAFQKQLHLAQQEAETALTELYVSEGSNPMEASCKAAEVIIEHMQ